MSARCRLQANGTKRGFRSSARTPPKEKNNHNQKKIEMPPTIGGATIPALGASTPPLVSSADILMGYEVDEFSTIRTQAFPRLDTEAGRMLELLNSR